MATVIAKNEFVEYDGKAKVSLENLFVEIYYIKFSSLLQSPLF